MQIKDVYIIFHVLVTWFIQKSGKYTHKARPLKVYLL